MDKTKTFFIFGSRLSDIDKIKYYLKSEYSCNVDYYELPVLNPFIIDDSAKYLFNGMVDADVVCPVVYTTHDKIYHLNKLERYYIECALCMGKVVCIIVVRDIDDTISISLDPVNSICTINYDMECDDLCIIPL